MGLIAFGTFVLLDLSHPSDAMQFASYLVAIGSFSGSCVVYGSRFNVRYALALYRGRSEEPDSPDAVMLTIVILIVSIAVTTGYFYLLGYNLFFLLLTGAVGDYSGLRLAAYSGDRYLAPGYVNQFKNTLYPLAATAIIIWLRRRRARGAWAFTIVSIAFGIFALLGTGQRAYILFAIFATLYGLHLLALGGGRQVPLGRVLVLLSSAFALFAMLTVAYEGKTGAGAGEVLGDISDRFLRIQQEGGVFGFRYVYSHPTPWFSEWAKGLSGVLPGHEGGSSIAHDLHGEMYGSTLGTVPLTAVGSAYENGGLLAIALLFGALGLLFSYLYHRFLAGPRTVLRSLAYGHLFFYLATYVVGPPESLIDAGVVTVIIFLLLCKVRWLPLSSVDTHLRLSR